MVNRLKMDFYRLFRTPLFYILIGGTVLLTLYTMGSFLFLDFSLNLEGQGLDKETVNYINSLMPYDFRSYIETFYKGNLFIIIIAIFAIVFSSAEYKSGYIKNTAAHTTPKYISYFSNLIIVAFFTFIVFLVGGIFISIACVLMKEINFDLPARDVIKYIGEIALFIFVKLLSNVSLTAFFLMLFYLLRSATPVMISSLTYTMLGSLLFVLINIVIMVAFNTKNFDISEYTNIGNMTLVGITSGTKAIVRSIIVSVAVLGISTFVSCYSLQKKDVR